ncbi:hypothetical protein [Meiothermus rufus]|uniref:hypothetical protein n=1 Tax=Meiothermus rufus TaxID=604332 RepID=UPI0012EC1DD9|nr:hypothetical protein [Meiothermus rufus]
MKRVTPEKSKAIGPNPVRGQITSLLLSPLTPQKGLYHLKSSSKKARFNMSKSSEGELAIKRDKLNP